jgi:hypothetical protein
MGKKRVNLSLSESEYEVLKVYAEVMNSNPTSIIHNVIQELIPVFRSVSEAINLAESNKNASLLKLQSTLLDGLNAAATISSDLQKEIKL